MDGRGFFISLKEETMEKIEDEKIEEISKEDYITCLRLQKRLLESSVPQNIPGIAVEIATFETRQLDGNFFHLYRPTPYFLDICLGDVLGKGAHALALATTVKSLIMRFTHTIELSALNMPTGHYEETVYTPKEILSLIHREISELLIDLKCFVSMFFGRFDLRYNTLTYVDCGFTQPIYYNSQNQKIAFLNGNGMPFGVVLQSDYNARQMNFNPGDLFLFYFNSLIQVKSLENEFFGVHRLAQLIEGHPQDTAGRLLDLVENAVITFAKRYAFDENLSVIGVKIDEKKSFPCSKSASALFSSDLSQLQEVREFIKKLCEHAPGDAERLTLHLQLLINEVFCNIVKYCYHDSPSGDIQIEGRLEDGGVCLIITDSGDVYNPFESSRSEDNLGLLIIEKVGENISYSPKVGSQTKNRLEINKKYFLSEEELFPHVFSMVETVRFHHEILDNILIATPQIERLDVKNSAAFRDGLIELIRNLDKNFVVLNLEQVQYMDSAGLGSFLSILRFLNLQHGIIKIINVNSAVQSIVEIVFMNRLFDVYSSKEEAVKSFKEKL